MEAKDTATFGAGCFWCVEAAFLSLDGVLTVSPGYMGGHKDNPTYEEVCTGSTGHAEVVRIEFDAKRITYEALLAAFFQIHDPTSLNRQGGDIGTQYRSSIFYENNQQKEAAVQMLAELAVSGAWGKPLVTAIEPAQTFWLAENYHQDYYRLNPENTYCKIVVKPKLEKFEKLFKDKLKIK